MKQIRGWAEAQLEVSGRVPTRAIAGGIFWVDASGAAHTFIATWYDGGKEIVRLNIDTHALRKKSSAGMVYPGGDGREITVMLSQVSVAIVWVFGTQTQREQDPERLPFAIVGSDKWRYVWSEEAAHAYSAKVSR